MLQSIRSQKQYEIQLFTLVKMVCILTANN